MKQKTPQGITLLDCAKASIEQFLKIRHKDPSNIKNDKYLLVTCDDGTGAIKIGYKNTYAQFLEAFKNLEATALTQIGSSLKDAFELLNFDRNVDNYGNGQYPFYIESSVIIILTDGGYFTSNFAITDQLIIPPINQNLQYTIEPFRWDQRVFSLVFDSQNENDNNPLAPICEVTGGTLRHVGEMKRVYPILEELNNRINQIGVIVNFDGPPEVISSHKMLYTKTTNGYWPIPENYMPTHQIQPRPAQPTIYLQDWKDFNVPDKFPMDQYEIEPCALTQTVMSTNGTFLCYVANSKGTSGFGDPFGFVKCRGSVVYLFVLPYNFFKLFSLLDDLVNVHKLIPSPQWRQELDRYLYSIPPYYIANIKPILKMKYSLNVSNIEDFKKHIKKKIWSKAVDVSVSENLDRSTLISTLATMRANLFKEKQIKYNSIPIHLMGNFQEVQLEKRIPLRNPFFEEDVGTKKKHKPEMILNIDEKEVGEVKDRTDIIDRLPQAVLDRFNKRIEFIEYKEQNKKLTQQVLRDMKDSESPLPAGLQEKKRKYIKTFVEPMNSFKKTKWLQELGFQ